MRAVGIGVGHEDDLAVTGRLEVEAAARAGADNLNDRTALGVFQHVADGGLLHVENLSANGQQRLELRIPGQFGCAKGRVAFHDEQFGTVDVIAAAVDEFGGMMMTRAHSCALRLPMLPGGYPGPAHRRLQQHRTGLVATILVDPKTRELPLDHLGNQPRHRWRAEHFLGLTLELRLASRTVTTAVMPSSTSSFSTSSPFSAVECCRTFTPWSVRARSQRHGCHLWVSR